MVTQLKRANIRIVMLLATALGVALALQMIRPTEAACSAPSPSLGSFSMSKEVSTGTTYRVWTRIMVPDTSKNSVLLEVDGGNCYVVGDNSAIPANTWTWVSYKDGNTNSPIDLNLSSGTHNFKVIGREAGVKVDRVILTADLSCVPNNTKDATGLVGNNCATPPDTTPPTVAITNVNSGSVLTGSVSVDANAADDTGGSGIKKVEFYINATLVGTDTTSPYGATVDTTQFTNGDYTLYAKAYDNGLLNTLDRVTVTIQNVTADVTDPSVPANVTATANAYNKVTVSWAASTDNVAVSGYYVIRNGVTLGQVTGNSYVDNTAIANTAYSYQVAAFDQAGNVSNPSTAINVTTPNAPDTTKPSTPVLNSVTLSGSTQLDLAWSASTDNIGVARYDIYRSTSGSAATKIGSATGLTYGDPGLAYNTAYTYYVVAVDGAGNASNPSNQRSATTATQADSNGLPKGTVVGRIVDQQGKTPIASATAMVTVNGVQQTYGVGANGYFATEPIPVGTYSFKIAAPGYTSTTKSATVIANQTVSLRQITLRRL